MKKVFVSAASVLLFGWITHSLIAQSAPRPALLIRSASPSTIELAWTNQTGDFSLERASSLTSPIDWQPVAQTPTRQGDRFSLTLTPSVTSQFYRLRQGTIAGSRVIETSPANGESGVAVTRETILRFSGPLAANSVLTTERLHGEFGGRRLLSRPELSSDRLTATLFYLENLPASARVQVTFDGNGLNDANGRPLDADGDGNPGGVFLMSFTTSGTTALANTAVIGKVFASELGATGTNRPLAGVIVTVDGAEETLRTTTDATGSFRLQPAPAGRFFVHVDGRTAVGSQWPNGAYYPFVGKAWDAVPGRTNNLAGGSGEIFLPLIQADALKAVSATTETRVTFAPSLLATNPSLAGVEIMVPANALFSDNGTRGGKVGMAPVPPDRLPEPLPPGLNLPLVITIQTDGGSNFDMPVPVKFPNLPDPVTGVKLGPGEKTALWSFNHDTGRWEIQGSCTISADGQFAVSDPGVGIRQPGWHGVGRGSGGSGPNGGGGPPPLCVGPDCECTQTILCTIPHEGKNYLTCMLECLGNPLKQIFGNNKTAQSPIQSGLRCIGGPDKCPGQPDDVLTGAQRKCMDECRYPDNEYIWYVVPCEGFTYPCPASASLQSLSVSPHLSPTNPLPDRLEEQSYFWKVEEDYLVRLTGTPKIVQMTPEELPILYAMFDLFSSYVRTGSLAGIHLSAGERAELVGLPRPSQFSLVEWGAMIDRLDTFQGSALPADVATAEKKFEDTITLLKSRGWQYRLDGFIQGHIRLSRARAPVLGSAKFPAQAHYFYLENHNTGFIQRGRLSRSGTFEGLILAPDNYFTVAYYDPVTRYAGAAFFKSSANGLTTLIPTAPLEPVPAGSLDTDGDRLANVAELVIGTNSTRPDTDGDGVGDFQELFANTNPLDGVVASVGVIAVLDTLGNAVDVTAWNDLVAVADSAAGVALFNVVNPQAPVLLAQLDTPGSAVSVAGVGQRLAVADSGAGMALYDVANPSAPTLLIQKVLSSPARAVAIMNDLIVVGLQSGELALLDEFGEILQRLTLPGGAIQDVLSREGLLYALQAGKLNTLTLTGLSLALANTVNSPGSLGAGGRRLRLSSDDSRIFASHTQGYNVFDLANPLAPILQRNVVTTQFGWQQIVADGSGLGLAAVGPNSTDDGPHDVSLYNLGSEGTNSVFQTTFTTPGFAMAVCLHQGLGFVADGTAGLLVIGYTTPDTGGQPPSLSLLGIFRPGPVTQMSGQSFRLLADARDDVRVRNVEFFLDGVRVGNDSASPYELELRAPILSTAKTSFSVQARATDTGGNSTLTPLQMVTLIPETVPPNLTSLTPTNATRNALGAFNPIIATFDERLLPASVTSANIRLELIEGSVTSNVPVTVTLSPNQWRVTVSFPSLEDSDNERRLQLSFSPGLTDVSGNGLVSTIRAEFNLVPVNRLTGGTVWNVMANWRTGVWPTAVTPVSLGTAGVPRSIQLNPPLEGAAFSLVAYDHLALLNVLNVVQDAVFHGKLTFVDQSSLTAGGEVRLHGGAEASGTGGGASLTAPLVRNFGTFLLDKDISNGQLAINGTTVFRNEPGAVFELRAGLVLLNQGGRFENHGQLTHTGAAPALLAGVSFQNFGRVDVLEGQLELHGGSENFGVSAIADGATLLLGKSYLDQSQLFGIRHSFAASSRLEGSGTLAVRESEVRFDGSVDFNGPIRFDSSRGSIAFNGVTRLRRPLDLTGGFSAMFQQPRNGNDVTFGGLSVQIDQPVVMGTNSTLTFNQAIPATLPGLTAQLGSRITGRSAVTVTGPAALNGAILDGTGAVRFDGPVEVSNLTGQGPQIPAAPKVIEFNGPARFGNPALEPEFHQFAQVLLRVQTNGVFDIARRGRFAYGIADVGNFLFENFGVVRHSASNVTSLDLRYAIRQGPLSASGVTAMTNWGTFEILAGELQMPALVQKAGLTVIRGGHLDTGVSGLGTTIEGGVFRLESGQFSGTLTYSGGQLEFPSGATLTEQLRIYGGTLDLAPPSLTVPSILQTNGTLRLNGGTLVVSNGFEIRQSGVLTGHGTLQGGMSMRGEINPGSPLGILTVTGSYTHENGGRFVVEIGGTNPGVGFDQLKVGSLSISSGATLDIRLVNGFIPALGAEFPILVKTGTGIPRAFATVTGLEIGGGKKFEAVYDATGVKLRVVAAP